MHQEQNFLPSYTHCIEFKKCGVGVPVSSDPIQDHREAPIPNSELKACTEIQSGLKESLTSICSRTSLVC